MRIYGKNCIREAIRSNRKIEEIFVEEIETKKSSNFIQMIKDKKIKCTILPKKEMDKKFPSNHQGYGAFVEDYKYKDLEVLFKKKEGRKIVLILDGIEDPHNFGAMIRSVDAFSIDGIIIPKNRSVSLNETVAHVSTGAIEYVNIIQVNNLRQSIETLKENGFWIVGTDASATLEAKDIDKNLNIAVIIGSEGFGISKILKDNSDYMIKIPMTGHVNSLNASVSCGIILALLK